MAPDKKETFDSLYRLADPLGGMISGGLCHAAFADEPRNFIQSISFPVPAAYEQSSAEGEQPRSIRSSSGSGDSSKGAVVPALAEMLERHAASCVEESRVFSASMNELGGYALDLHTLPACSAREMENRNCYVAPPQPDKPIRWVEGVSLGTGKPCALPFALVYLYTGKLLPQERLQAPISTGLAAHRNLSKALVSGVLEVMERDALSLMWLQMIPGRQIESCGGKERAHRSTAAVGHLRYYFYDISTDLEVSVVCCIRRSPESDRVHTLVSCAAGFDQVELIEKATRDIAAHSIGFRKDRPTPQAFEDFTAIHHGATFMAHRDRASAFSFLIEEGIKSSEANHRAEGQAEGRGLMPSEQQLAYLLDRLDACGFEAYAVDLTTVEAFSAGMRVVRVIVPGLQPLPYRYATRYLAHPRLYDAPRKMGYRVRPESEINQWPLPFS